MPKELFQEKVQQSLQEISLSAVAWFPCFLSFGKATGSELCVESITSLAHPKFHVFFLAGSLYLFFCQEDQL